MLWYNRYIVSACHQLVADVTQQLDSYTMGQAGDQIQTFLWYSVYLLYWYKSTNTDAAVARRDQFADWYLEASKVRIFAAQKSDDPQVQAAAAQVCVCVCVCVRACVYIQTYICLFIC